MALFFLEYDLRNQRSYQPLYDELASFGAVRVLESSWCFHRFNTNPEQIRNYFMQFMDNDDGICVTEVVNWATSRTNGNPHSLK